MASDPAFCDDVTARLAPMGPVETKRMFGGFGYFLDGLMFGLIADDAFYFKADGDNRPAFEAAGGRPFTFTRNDKPVETSFWRVPAPVFADQTALIDWAVQAHQAAQRAKRKKPKRK